MAKFKFGDKFGYVSPFENSPFRKDWAEKEAQEEEQRKAEREEWLERQRNFYLNPPDSESKGTYLIVPINGCYMTKEAEDRFKKIGQAVQGETTPSTPKLSGIVNDFKTIGYLKTYIKDNNKAAFILLQSSEYEAEMKNVKTNANLPSGAKPFTEEQLAYQNTPITKTMRQKYITIDVDVWEGIFKMEGESTQDSKEQCGILLRKKVGETIATQLYETTGKINSQNEVEPLYWKSKTVEGETVREVDWAFLLRTTKFSESYFEKYSIVAIHTHHIGGEPPSAEDINMYNGADPLLKVAKKSWWHLVTSTPKADSNERILYISYGLPKENLSEGEQLYHFDRETQLLIISKYDIDKHIFKTIK